MNCNVGKIERSIRVGLGALLIGWSIVGGLPAWGALVAGILGAVALLSGLVGFCPAWKILGISTCAKGASTGSEHPK